MLRDAETTPAPVSLPTAFESPIDPAGVERCTVAGERVFGILQDEPAQNRPATVRADRTSFAVLGAPAMRFGRLMADAQAALIPAVAGAYVVAIALELGARVNAS